jgi:hypothetical protein
VVVALAQLELQEIQLEKVERQTQAAVVVAIAVLMEQQLLALLAQAAPVSSF